VKVVVNYTPNILYARCRLTVVDGLQHKGAMSTKPVFKEIAKIQRSYVHYVDIWHLCFWHCHVLSLLLTKSRYFAMMQNKHFCQITGN